MNTEATPTGQTNTDTGATQTDTTTQTAEGAKTPESQSATTTTPEGKTEDGKTDASKAAPETYADFTMPEGMQIDAETTAEFSSFAKDLNLSQEQAQKLVDLAAKQVQKSAESIRNLSTQVSQQWHEQSLSDKEFGGANMKANLAVAEKAINQFNPELYTFLKESGLGNHPEMVRFAYRVGKAITEDKVVTSGDENPNVGKDPAKVMFPSMH